MGPPLPSPAVGRETTMYFWTLPGPEGAVLGAAVVAVETSLTMGCTLGTVVVTGEVVVEPEPGAEVLRDKTWGKEGRQCQLPCTLHSPGLGESFICSNQGTTSSHPQEPVGCCQFESLAHDEQL